MLSLQQLVKLAFRVLPRRQIADELFLPQRRDGVVAAARAGRLAAPVGLNQPGSLQPTESGVQRRFFQLHLAAAERRNGLVDLVAVAVAVGKLVQNNGVGIAAKNICGQCHMLHLLWFIPCLGISP